MKLRLPTRKRDVPPLYRYPQRWTPTPAQIAELDMIRMACPWCGAAVWTYPHAEPVGLARYYDTPSGHGIESGDSICTACGRRIFMFGQPWVYYAEFDDDGGGELYWSWEEQALGHAGVRSGSRPPDATPLRTWSRSDPDAPTIYTKIRDAGPHPCSLGQHVRAWYCSGWAGVPGALVLWRCGRCHVDLGWGRYEDGPAAPYLPEPSRVQRAAWEREGRRLEAERDRVAEEARAQDVEGECNARRPGARCTRPAGHEGTRHGVEIAPGILLAPWRDE